MNLLQRALSQKMLLNDDPLILVHKFVYGIYEPACSESG